MTKVYRKEFILLSPNFLAPILPNCLMQQRVINISLLPHRVLEKVLQ